MTKREKRMKVIHNIKNGGRSIMLVAQAVLKEKSSHQNDK